MSPRRERGSPGRRAAAQVPAPVPPAPRDVLEALGPIVDREGGGPADWPERLSRYLGLLLRRNAALNLVSRRTVDEVLERQVLPSLAVLRLVRPGGPCRVLDVGTGGGFPGIPLRILRPDVRLDLVEATRNKCRFLEECVAALGWEDVGVHWCRIESPSGDLLSRAPFDRVVARAVGQEGLLARAVRPLLAEGGEAWVFAPPGDGEIEWIGRAGEPVTALRRLPPPGG